MFGLALDISLRIVIAAAAVGAVLGVMRVRSGAARHAAWSAVLLAMLTMPLLTAVVPRVEVPVPSTLALDPGAIAEQAVNDDRNADVAAGSRRSSSLTQDGAPVTIPNASASHRVAAPATPINWVAPAIFIYASGFLYFMLRLSAGWLLARRLVQKATPVTLAAHARVVESAAVAAPLTTGIVSPTIVLPSNWREWPADKLRAALAHEHAHIARRDCLVSLLAQVNRALFWFHPLAWWLERTLSATAEHACDETVVQQFVEPRRYAEILLDMAEAVSVRGSRVAWPAIGVDGSGLLGARINRVLRGDAIGPMSVARRVALAAACAAVLLLAIACRQRVMATPLRPDPEVQKTLDADRARAETHKAAVSMSVSDAAAVEASLETNPKDLDAREKLITYYWSADAVRWDDKVSGLRRHALWLIANAPDSGVWIPVISRRHDPKGYEAARQLWLEQAAKPDVPAKVLAAAADFLSASDKALAEQLLLRGRTMDPDGAALRTGVEPGIAAPAWSARLGLLYARAIAGSVDQTTGAIDPAEAASPFAAEARRTLDATTDTQILRTAGAALASRFRGAPENAALGRTYLERAVQLDPRNVEARAALANAAANDRRAAIEGRLRAAGARDKFDEFSDTTYAAVSALPADDRLFYVPWAAESAYMRAESIEFTARDKPAGQKAEANRKAQAGWRRARQYAEDALTLAAANTNSPDHGAAVYRANIVLGVIALKDGHRERSVEYMARAGNAPPSDTLRYSLYPGLRGRLVEYLLREGERESVAAFLEKSAGLTVPGRERLLKDAAQIRDGIMPLTYQYAEARR